MKYSSPPDRHIYYAQVWEVVRQVPAGKVTTYGQVAGYLSPPVGMSERDYKAWGPRWVGGAMAACPEDVPWQRVINAQGKISLPAGAGHDHQRQLLETEGITFGPGDRINIKVYGWEGPEPSNRRPHQLGFLEE